MIKIYVDTNKEAFAYAHWFSTNEMETSFSQIEHLA